MFTRELIECVIKTRFAISYRGKIAASFLGMKMVNKVVPCSDEPRAQVPGSVPWGAFAEFAEILKKGNMCCSERFCEVSAEGCDLVHLGVPSTVK